MSTTKTHSGKATLIAAALIITASTAVFGSLADEAVETTPQGRSAFHQELTDEQKAVLTEAKELRDAGDREAAKALLDEAGIRPPKGKMRRHKFMENLTDEQKVVMEEARALRDAGDKEGAKALIEGAGIERPERKHKSCDKQE